MTLYVPLAAITDTIHRRVCPLYTFDERERVHVIGSAVPFRSGGISFLITAAHVCMDLARAKAPVFTWGESGPRALMSDHIMWEHVPARPDFDIGLISLSDEDAADIAVCHQFCDPSATARVKPAAPGVHYLIAGFPATRNRLRPLGPSFPGKASLPDRATWLMTGNVVAVTELRLPEKTELHHFALSFKGARVRKPDGEPFNLPKPQGMSGGGVWRLDIDPQTKLATTPLLVGIGIEYHKSEEAFVATRVQLAIPLVYDLLRLKSGMQPADVLRIGGAREAQLQAAAARRDKSEGGSTARDDVATGNPYEGKS